MTPFQLAGLAVRAAKDKKAWHPVKLNVKGLTLLADYFVVCEGETDRQVRAIADNIVAEAKKEGHRALAVEGYSDASWIVVDLDSVVVHVFTPGERAYYDLETLWREPKVQQLLERRQQGA
ncbi:MAG: ribosome silencing factor [Candidatus Dormibacteria bacterium]